MAEAKEKPVSQVLRAAADGDRQAAAELLPLLYEELRKLAHSLIRKLPPGQTLQATALVHEAFMRIARRGDPGWNCRGHFFVAAARAMRQILVEQARRKASIKGGGKWKRVDLHESDTPIEPPSQDILAVNQALERLEALDPEKAKLVTLRYFAGLTLEETAVALNMSPGQLKRPWKFVLAWLRHECGAAGTRGDGS